MGTLAKSLGIAAAIAGAIGTVLLYFGTFGFEAPAVWASKDFVDQMKARNRRRLFLQRVGLVFLMISFVLGGISVAVSS
jgi:hypothetical protein